jgi:hypothetical protein
VGVGATLKADQIIGQATGGQYGIETGWANAALSGPLTPYGSNPDGTPMPGGISFRHFTGYRMGGIPFAGSFDGGGVIPGYPGQPVMALMHGGEVVLPGYAKGTSAAKAAAAMHYGYNSLTDSVELHTTAQWAQIHAQVEKESHDAAARKKRAEALAREATAGFPNTRVIVGETPPIGLYNFPKPGTIPSPQHPITMTFAQLKTIPSQGIAGQIKMATLQNQVAAATNAGNTAAEGKGLHAEMRLERQWLASDQRRLKQINRALRTRGLPRAKRAVLLQDKLALLQEIGTIEGDIGSTQTSLSDLATSSDTSAGGSGDVASALDAMAQAADALRQELANQTAYMKSVGEIEKRAAIATLADLINGEIGGNYLSRSTGSAGAGTVVTY